MCSAPRATALVKLLMPFQKEDAIELPIVWTGVDGVSFVSFEGWELAAACADDCAFYFAILIVLRGSWVIRMDCCLYNNLL